MTGGAWAFLIIAIGCEVAATLSLRMAVLGHKIWYLAVASGYLIALGLLSLALHDGMPLGVAYGIWTAAGVALTAMLSKVLFREPFTLLMGVGVGLVGAGVLLVELGAAS